MPVTKASGALFLEQLANEFHGCSLVPPSLHEQVGDLTFVVNRAPQPELPARNYHGHLLEMPPGRWPRASTPDTSLLRSTPPCGTSWPR